MAVVETARRTASRNHTQFGKIKKKAAKNQQFGKFTAHNIWEDFFSCLQFLQENNDSFPNFCPILKLYYYSYIQLQALLQGMSLKRPAAVEEAAAASQTRVKLGDLEPPSQHFSCTSWSRPLTKLNTLMYSPGKSWQ